MRPDDAQACLGPAAVQPALALFSVPPGRAYLPSLARAILDGTLISSGRTPVSPLGLAATTVLLPTRRAVRGLEDALLAAAPGGALVMPRIRAIAEPDDDALWDAGLPDTPDASIPSAMPEIERRLTLSALVIAWSDANRRDTGFLSADAPVEAMFADTPAKAVQLATGLGKLLDTIENSGLKLLTLDGLVPDEFAQHWQSTSKFLEIITRLWPAHLAERGVLSPAGRRNKLLAAEAARISRMAVTAPVVVAGVSGSLPATIAVMRAALAHPSGAVVLPAVDLALDDDTWTELATDRYPEHPQQVLAGLLRALGVTRQAISPLPGASAEPVIETRSRFVSEALRPAPSTVRWHEAVARLDRPSLAAAVQGLAILEAPTAQTEADAVALVLRSAVATPGKTAALVTPDRRLARRVVARLGAAGIVVDDSAGRPLGKTIAGTFFDLVVAVASNDFAPASVMSLLHHPMCRLGLTRENLHLAATALDLAVFRALFVGSGIETIRAALIGPPNESGLESRQTRAAMRLDQSRLAAAHDLLARLEQAFDPLVHAFKTPAAQPSQRFARAHSAVAEALSKGPTETGTTPLWHDNAGVILEEVFAVLTSDDIRAPAISSRDYADFWRTAMAGQNARQTAAAHPRIAIWGPMEARLQHRDLLVLGGLNEGTWPEQAEPGPWLSRAMAEKLHLPPPERDIGLSAHDFTSLLETDEVVLTRAEKIDGTPTTKSRWLLRLETLLSAAGVDAPRKTGDQWLAWATHSDETIDHTRPWLARPPAPCPPMAARPRSMSVSMAETWMANPYAVYASRILRLEPLPALGSEPGAQLQGNLIHSALAEFTRRHPRVLPADSASELYSIAADLLRGWLPNPRIAAFWLPRFHRFATWFAATEPGRRASTDAVHAEVAGRLTFPAPEGDFVLTCRADRIDVGESAITITDFKRTAGVDALQRRAERGEAPQLRLEAAIGNAGGFETIKPLPATLLRYVSASGGEPPGAEVAIRLDDVGKAAAQTLDGFAALVARFDNPMTPYRATRRRGFEYGFDAYAHLARVAEWHGEDGEGDA